MISVLFCFKKYFALNHNDYIMRSACDKLFLRMFVYVPTS